MNFTLSLPDDLGARAKALEKGVMSRLLRDAVTAELERRETMAKTLDKVETYEVHLADNDGAYIGRITGQLIASDERADVQVFLTDDERVIVYDGGKERHFVSDDPAEDLRNWLSEAEYAAALRALGEEPIIDL